MGYGIEIRDQNGVLIVRPSEVLSRIVHVQEFEGDYAGTISVPAFDSARGLFYAAMHAKDSRLGVGPDTFPSLSWNNTAKVMTIAPNDLPAGWPGKSPGTAFILVFLHVSGVTVV